ncbi:MULTISPECIES: hypothetical protein [unclassified Methylocaldum]|jgi:hypothetical protein|uniref:hypothetical protein n=1 Tax=unclassified Methylocaldum TaxID=2622260 RepID=UPI00098AF044|nr:MULTISPECIES: hypothetical protein [unclassified Methylocaldum]MBP1151170.1 hypothetical protein [Methylocaldum sp. RMAD-M]
MTEENYLKDLNESLKMFQTYFPEKREDVDIIILRGHQLAESLLYKFIKQNVNHPEYIDSFFIRWEPLVALVRAMKNENTKEYDWVWPSLMQLERARNQIAHNLEAEKLQIKIRDFINCVRSRVSEFGQIPGDDDLKKAIFIVYCGLSTALAVDKWPNITATYLVRDMVEEHGRKTINQGCIDEKDT